MVPGYLLVREYHTIHKVAISDTLHIGNLPTEKVSKRDVFRRFSKYGKLGQISLKQAYGFVQYLESSSCSRALDAEQDRPLKGRKMRESLLLI
jgi:RNA recognition motif-containing protein